MVQDHSPPANGMQRRELNKSGGHPPDQSATDAEGDAFAFACEPEEPEVDPTEETQADTANGGGRDQGPAHSTPQRWSPVIGMAPPSRTAMHKEIARWQTVESVWSSGTALCRILGYGALFAAAGKGLDVANFLGGALLADAGSHGVVRGLHWRGTTPATNREAGMIGLGLLGFVLLEGWPAIPEDPNNRALAFLGFLSVLGLRGIPRIHMAMRR